jgi:serine/threonine protein kinase
VLNASGYGKEVDMWSIGVITYILLCGFPPFYGDTVPEIFEQIMEANFDYPEEYWGSVTKEGKPPPLSFHAFPSSFRSASLFLLRIV